MGLSLYQGDAASCKKFLKSIQSEQLVHLASHGVVDSELGELRLAKAARSPAAFFEYQKKITTGARLVFAGANRFDVNSASPALLSGEQISTLDLGKLRLVFLSLCEGATGGAVSGDRPFSVARAFLGAGASMVVASVLPVG